MTDLNFEKIRTFVRERVAPHEKIVAERGFRKALPDLQKLRDEVRAMGLFTPHVAKAHGGAGLTLLEHARMSEELGWTPLGHWAFNCQAPDAGNMEILIEHGTAKQKEMVLAPLVRGEIRTCFSMTEPDAAGSNPTWLETTAKKDGDHYVIRGRKWFTTGADGARFAIVMAVTNPDAPPHLRASQIIVPTDAPGFRLLRNIPVMGEAGEDWPSHSEIAYEDVRVPIENRLGEEGMGFTIAQDRLGPGRIHHAMRWMGICERSFHLMCERAAKREIAPGKKLGTKQIVQAWIAESRAEIDAARLLILHTAQKIQTEGTYGAREEISLVKFYAAGVMERVIDRAIQTHGALGMTDDTPLAFFHRHERAARIYDGPDEVHKVVVARRILKKYGLEA